MHMVAETKTQHFSTCDISLGPSCPSRHHFPSRSHQRPEMAHVLTPPRFTAYISVIPLSPVPSFTPVCSLRPAPPSNHPAKQPQPRPSSPPSPPSPTPPSPPLSLSPSLSLALLNLVTLLWGTQHAITKLALQSIPPPTLNLSRFLLAALISLPSLPLSNPPLYRAAFELSTYLFLGYACQTISLQTLPASRSAFLLYLNVKFVPLLAAILYRRPIPPSVWAAAATAFTGTVLLVYDGSPPVIGDAWSLAAAVASAFFILRVEKYANFPAAQLNAASLLGVASLCTIWALFTDSIPHFHHLLPTSLPAASALFYLAFVTTALTNFLQTLAQRNVSAERAAVVFALDPVYGAFFAYVLLGERLGARGILGAAFIIVAALFSNKAVLSKEKSSD